MEITKKVAREVIERWERDKHGYGAVSLDGWLSQFPDKPECIVRVLENESQMLGPTILTEKEQNRWDRAKKIAETLNAKNKAYGDSFAKSGEVLSILFPDISKGRATVILAVARIIDKLFRIANDTTAFGEDPAMDIAGYGMLLQELVSNE